MKNRLVAFFAAAAMAVVPVQRAAADAKDVLLGIIAGGAVATIINENNRNKPPKVVTTTRTVVVTPETPVRAANRVPQTSLNYFSFNSGGVDGIFGPQTARAASGYQSFMNFPVTGRLTPYENEILVSAYNRAQVGDYATLQLINTSPMGPRALLFAQRDIMAGVAPANAGTGSTPVTATSDYTPPPTTESTVGTTTVVTTGLPLIPVPTGNGDLAAFCATDAVTGPRITPASMTDPNTALDQAFCGARADAIAASDGMAAAVQGVSLADIEAQCQQLGPVMQPYVSALNSGQRDSVMADVNSFVTDSGSDPVQLASTARICLGTGYRTDNMTVALGSGLLLVSLGEAAYGELMGHHLYRGFGVAADESKAIDWLVWTTDALATGATPVFGTGDGTRLELVDEAVFRLNGGAPSSAAKTTSTKGKLPVVGNN